MGVLPFHPTMELCAAHRVGNWRGTEAWDTRWQVSAHCTGLAAGSRDMLPLQILLMCSEPPSLPATFGSHTCRPAPLTSISLFFFVVVEGCLFHQNLISTL